MIAGEIPLVIKVCVKPALTLTSHQSVITQQIKIDNGTRSHVDLVPGLFGGSM